MMYNLKESKKLENNKKEITDRFEKAKQEIDNSIKNLEVKIAEIFAGKKNNDVLKNDILKLGTIINEVDNNLVDIKNMLK